MNKATKGEQLILSSSSHTARNRGSTRSSQSIERKELSFHYCNSRGRFRAAVVVFLAGLAVWAQAQPASYESPTASSCAAADSRIAASLPAPSVEDNALALMPDNQSLGTWIELGPAPTLNGQVNIPPDNRVCGAIHAIAAHSTNPDILYIAAVNGGVWGTRNATAANPTWTPLTDRLLSLSMGAIAFDPTDASGQTLVAGSAHTSAFGARGGLRIGFLRTTDGGTTWTVLGGASFANEDLTSVAARGNILLAGSDATYGNGAGNGVFRSTDTGANWQVVSGAPGSGLPMGSVSDIVGDPGNDDRFYAAVVGVGIFRSEDAGATWTNVTPGITGIGANTDKIEIAVHDSALGNAVFVGIVNSSQLSRVFRSATHGEGWTQMDVPPQIHFGSQGDIHFSIVADPTDPNIVYLGGDRINSAPWTGNLIRGDASLAAGTQFTTIMDGNAGNTTPHADSRDMAFDANGNLIDVDDGGIYRRTSPRTSSGTWSSVVGNLAVIEAHDVAYDSVARIGMVGVQDNGTHIMQTPGSSVWTSISGGDGGDVAIDDTTLAGQSIRYGSSQDLGNFYRRVYDAANNVVSSVNPALNVLAGGPAMNNQFVTPIELNKVDPARIAIGCANSVYESLDRGDNVTALSPGFGVNRSALAYGGWLNGVVNADVLYFGSGSTVRLRTTAGGTVTATAGAFPGGTIRDIVLDTKDWRRAYVIDASAVFLTPDAGTNWVNITGNLTDVGSLRSLEFLPFGNCVFCVAVGTDTGVYVMPENKLGEWVRLGAGLPDAPAYDLAYNGNANALVVGTLGRGAWLLDVPGPAPRISIPGDVTFADTCVGTTNLATLYVCNTCTSNLYVGPITSSNPQFQVVTPSSGYPVVISPDFCFPFRVRFVPAALGDQSTTLTVPSNDPVSPTNLVAATGKGAGPALVAFVADSGNFGDVCLGSFRDLNLTINNAGGCTLVVSDITSSSPQFLVPALTSAIVIHPGDSVAVPIRFQPTSLGAKTGTIIITSNDPASPKFVNVNGNVPPGDIRVTGSAEFGLVCAGTIHEKTISICNVGKCNLNVTSVGFVPNCADFTLVNNPFPAVVSHDSCVDVVIRFTPSSCGPKACNLRIVSDDPDTPIINLAVTATTPCAAIDVPPDLAFPPTVVKTLGPCQSVLPFPISNTGPCPLKITNIQLGGVNPGDFSFIGLPSFPIILLPGHIVGSGDFGIGFSPSILARSRLATVTVTYEADPVTGATATVTRALGGEGVNTGARVLVMVGGIPIQNVEKIQLQRINANRNRKQLDTQDVTQDATLQTQLPPPPIEPFQYHREYGTVGNPVQLLAGSYQLTVTAIVNGKRKTQVVGFDVSTCDFNPAIVINY